MLQLLNKTLKKSQKFLSLSLSYRQFSTTKMDIITIPALQDNYMYLLVDQKTKETAAIDPVEPQTILEHITKYSLHLTTILTTHHHWDHAGGNIELSKRLENSLTIINNVKPRVYGGDERVEGLTDLVEHGTRIQMGDNIDITCLFTPCHTNGHVCYYATPKTKNEQSIGNSSGAVFTGDTLFIGGCGRFFEGTAEQMYVALYDILGTLPNETRVYCGHEYTAQNLRFAQHVEPENEDIREKMQWVLAARERGEPTVPSTIGEEKLFNPFMRCSVDRVQKYAKCDEDGDAVETMRVLREDKDLFKG